jgi:ADP-heptose:LPS heptosyltransferase
VIEPNVPRGKSIAPNKQWPLQRYVHIALELQRRGYQVAQLWHGNAVFTLPAVKLIPTPNFRVALAALSRARLYLGPEGGLHHGAAAVGVPAAVIFGGFVPPQVTGYDFHVNLSAGGEACGSMTPCKHCRAALDAISIDQVLGAALSLLATQRHGRHVVRR